MRLKTQITPLIRFVLLKRTLLKYKPLISAHLLTCSCANITMLFSGHPHLQIHNILLLVINMCIIQDI